MTPLYHPKQPIPHASGIYRITCESTGRFYIGSAVDLYNRWANHFSSLRRNVHKNPKLQRAWNKYGEEDFTFEVLELVLTPFLIEREQHYLDTLHPFFNIAKIAGSTLGQTLSPEHREKLRNFRLGKKHSEESKRKMSESRKGIPREPKVIEKMLAASRGRIVSDETRAKISAARTGKKLSDETRRKVGEASKGRKQSPEAIEKTRLAHIGKKRSPETCAKISEAKQGRKIDPSLYESRRKTLIITDPDGTEYFVQGVYKFCKEHQLHPHLLMRVAKGEQDNHKGWKARYPSTDKE